LANCDRTIATFAARQWQLAGGSIRTKSASQALQSAPPAVREGFQRLMESERLSLEADVEQR
jgi:hypothetical protein